MPVWSFCFWSEAPFWLEDVNNVLFVSLGLGDIGLKFDWKEEKSYITDEDPNTKETRSNHMLSTARTNLKKYSN